MYSASVIDSSKNRDKFVLASTSHVLTYKTTGRETAISA